MNPRALELIEQLHLAPHPEGGHFAENHRSSLHVLLAEKARSAGTHIHYLLNGREVSRWHRLDADEIWHLYEGGPLELHLLSADFSSYHRVRLAAGLHYMTVVPAGCWQAANCPADYVLVGCTVFPGFEFDKFELLRDLAKEKKEATARYPELAWLL